MSVAQRITESLLRRLPEIVQDAGASALFVYADVLEARGLTVPPGIAQKVFHVSRSREERLAPAAAGEERLRIPNVALSRLGLMKMAVFLALSRGFLRRGDVIVCLSGVAESATLDTLLVLEVGQEFEIVTVAPEDEAFPVQAEVLERVVEIAAEIGSEGREGRAVGALFVVGDADRALSMTRQLILNPFAGYPEEQRNLLDPALTETIKEFASVDGAFVIRGDGVILSAGTYLKTATSEEQELPKGLGARHHAAAGITSVSDAVAVVVSQSTGSVTIFHGGHLLTTIERPRTPDDSSRASP